MIFDSVSNSVLASVGKKYHSASLINIGDFEAIGTTTSFITTFPYFSGTGGSALVYCGGSTSYTSTTLTCPSGFHAMALVAIFPNQFPNR